MDSVYLLFLDLNVYCFVSGIYFYYYMYLLYFSKHIGMVSDIVCRLIYIYTSFIDILV